MNNVMGGSTEVLSAGLMDAAKFDIPSATNLKIEVVPVAVIKPYWRNPRKNDAAVEPVVESIKRYGYCQPILLDRENVIIAGHTRYRALLKLGVEKIAVVYSDMEPEKAKQFRIVDNKTAEIADWKHDDLLAELREFENIESFQIFFPGEDLMASLQDSLGNMEKDITEGDVKKAGEENVTFTAHREQIEVLCPSCANAFYVNRKDLLERPSNED